MKAQRGFTLFEMIVAITLVVVLYVTMLDKLMPLRGDAEAANVATVAGAIRGALGMEVASRLMHDQLGGVGEMEGMNPMTLLAEQPDTYLGEVRGVSAETLPIGHWYFDSASGELVYLVRFTDYFRTELPGPARMVFRVEVVRNEMDIIAGVRLRRVNAFVWTQSPQLAELLTDPHSLQPSLQVGELP